MSTYKAPKIKSLNSKSLIELMGPCVTQYQGSLDIGAARRGSLAELNVHKDQIVICKHISQRQDGIVRLG